jgi:Arc/MetJ-type ribon-helix-helix transcriptional regulator
MTIQLKPEHERIIQQQLASGRYRSVDEVLDTALSKLSPSTIASEDPRQAVQRMIEFAEKRFVRLPPGEKIKDLLHEGHRY